MVNGKQWTGHHSMSTRDKHRGSSINRGKVMGCGSGGVILVHTNSAEREEMSAIVDKYIN